MEGQEDLSVLSVKELKRRLGGRGIDHTDCFEKSDLVHKLQAALAAEPSEPPVAPPAAAGRGSRGPTIGSSAWSDRVRRGDLAQLVKRGPAAQVVAALRDPAKRVDVAYLLISHHTSTTTWAPRFGARRLRELVQAGVIPACLSVFEYPRGATHPPDAGMDKHDQHDYLQVEFFLGAVSNMLIQDVITDPALFTAACVRRAF